jgi:hypothetical protein
LAFPPAPNNCIFQVFEQLLPIGIIPKNRLSRVTARHHVVDCTGVLDAQRASHPGSLSTTFDPVNKKQGLTL